MKTPYFEELPAKMLTYTDATILSPFATVRGLSASKIMSGIRNIGLVKGVVTKG